MPPASARTRSAPQARDREPATLRALGLTFLRLGASSFGGPAAHIAMMEDEVVRRRGWLRREEFLDLVGATNLIPGPNSTEVAIHVGYARAGWAGLVVAGLGFILPAIVIVWGIAWGYARYATLPATGAFFGGVAPVVLAIIALALWRLARTALFSALTVALAAAALLALLLGVHEIAVLVAAGVIAYVDRRVTDGGVPVAPGSLAAVALHDHPERAIDATVVATGASTGTAVVATAGAGATTGAAAGAAVGAVGLSSLFLVFLKAGALLFGSGYVLVAFLRTDLVMRLGWLTESQLLDAIAVGQVTPGPVFTTATFIGFVLAGHAGALVATLGIFVPAFVFVALTAPLLPRLRASADLRAALDGVNAASVALLVAACLPLAGRAVDHPLVAVPVFATTLILLGRRRVNTAWLVLGGGLIGLLL